MSQLTLTGSDAATPTIALAGRLEAVSLGPVWTQARQALARNPDRPVVVDCRRVDYCDGAGVALLVDLLRTERAPGAAVRIEGLRDGFQRLLDQYDPVEFRAPPPQRQSAGSLIERLGHAGRDWWRGTYDLITFVGEGVTAVVAALRRPHSVRWRDAILMAEEAGVNALPIVALIGFLMGVILAFGNQVERPCIRHGGGVHDFEPRVGGFLGSRLAARRANAFLGEVVAHEAAVGELARHVNQRPSAAASDIEHIDAGR
jgi:phospholipid/cholesterol/gamma-HCH transport system permease protein